MRKLIFTTLLAAFFCFIAANGWAKIIINPPPEVPSDISARDVKTLMFENNALLDQFYATQEKIDNQAANCDNVEEGSPKVNECMEEAQAVKNAVRKYREAVQDFGALIAQAVSWQKFVSAMADQTASSAHRNQHAITVESHGEFTILAADGGKLSAQDAARLTDKDKIRFVTGANGWAFLAMPAGTNLKLDPNTELLTKSTDSNSADQHPAMTLVKGTLLWWHKYSTELVKQLELPSSGGDEGTLRLPACVVGVRGTEFESVVLPDGSGHVSLYSGKLLITPKAGKSFEMMPGQMISFTKNKLGPVRPIAASLGK